ncbi:three component ABC system middle component [Halomonas sp. PAMB 3264]|uniref:three component ABC system middle component n=1 Tax=Halomonas sp. PAMB 3264 TaxID=3075222 RepID=UPI00289B89A2|nr:three component ABC system middle component [Halomonas sp. PAMB 3264]WNL42337.1 three component ABC system middle component [Halomonas sp. PAMB 3264]
MNRLSQNELIGAVAIQSALENSTECRLSLAKAMLVLPLLFDRAVRSVLKRKNSVVLSSKDLLISNPPAFITVRARYEDLTITSLNTILLAQELGMATLKGDYLVLNKQIFLQNNPEIGKIALDILAAGPKLGLILSEATADLYQTFRIEL